MPPARFLALGDSYTICTGATSPERRWPSLVAARLQEALQREVITTNLGVDGYTTTQLIAHELSLLGDALWDWLTVLIGVNDFYSGFDQAGYRERMARIYDAIAAARTPHVLAISIPDYSYTPTGRASGDPSTIVDGLRGFNATARGLAEQHAFTWVDIFDLSRSLIATPGWISEDGLHPGDIQYAAWAEHIWTVMRPLASPAA